MTQTLEPTTGTEPSAARTRVETWLADFEAALAARDADRAAGLFATTSFWRDLIAFSWNFTTVENRDGRRRPAARRRWRRPTPRTSGSPRARSPRRPTASSRRGSTFETAVGRGSGLLRLNDEGAWTFLTTLDELKGHEENQGATRPRGVRARRAARTGSPGGSARTAELEGLGRDREPYVRRDRRRPGRHRARCAAAPARRRPRRASTGTPRPGDQWRSRYKSLCLHDPVWYDHLPYLPFPRNWPVFAPKDKIGDWLEMYTRVMEVNYWGSTTAKSATWDDAKKEWTVTVDRDGEEVVLHPKQLVFALGVSGKPNIPSIPGQDVFARRAAPQLASTPARTPTRTSGSSSSARTTPRSTSAGRCGRSART